MFRRPTPPGWLSILVRKQELQCAHVVRDGDRATLKWIHSFARSGQASDADDLRQLRRQLALENHRCSTLIMRGTYQTFEVPAPKVDRSEWRDALRWVVKDGLEFPIEDAMIETMPIPNDGAPPGREPMTFVIAARRDAVAERVQAFQRARLALSVISVSNMAQRNAAAMFEVPGRGLAFLGIYLHSVMLTFTCDASVYATRNITHVAEDMRDDAEPERRQLQINRIVLEVQRALDSFDRQFSHVALQRMVVCAPGGHSELLKALRQNLNQTIELADLRQVMDTSSCPALDDVGAQSNWMMAVGLALRIEDAA